MRAAPSSPRFVMRDWEHRGEFVRVRREPFSRNGLGAKSFAERTRFAKVAWGMPRCASARLRTVPSCLATVAISDWAVMAPHIAAQPAAFVFGIERGLAEVSNPEN